MELGPKPNLPNDLIKNILPKTPAIVFPTRPKEYFLNRWPVMLAPIIPITILIREIKVFVILGTFNDRNPFYLFYPPLVFFV